MDFGAMLEPITKALGFIGLPAPLLGTAVAVGFLLRYTRGMVRWFGPGSALVAALLAGIAVTLSAAAAAGWNLAGEPGKSGIAFVAAVLIIEAVLHKAADKIPWIPGDNQWAKPDDATPPTQGGK